MPKTSLALIRCSVTWVAIIFVLDGNAPAGASISGRERLLVPASKFFVSFSMRISFVGLEGA